MKSLGNRPSHGTALAVLTTMFSLCAALAASAQTIQLSPDTAPPGLLNVQSLPIDASATNQSDPHVDGGLIAYVDDTHINYFRVGVDAAPQSIPLGDSLQDLLPNAFGTRIAFSRVHGDSAGTTAVMVFDTSQPASVSNPFEVDPQPGGTRFSAAIGGTTLAFIDSGLAAGGELLVYDLGTASLIRLTNDAEIDANPNVSPDGNTVVWSHCASSYALCDVWKAVKSNGTWSVSVVSSDPADEQFPDTNGSISVYSSDRPSGAGDIFFRDAGGDEHELLLDGTQINPNISGDFITFESRNGEAAGEIDLYQVSTNRLWQLTTTTANEELDDVTVLPTGELLVVYDSDEFGSSQRTVHALRFTVPSTTDDVPPSISVASPVDGAVYAVNSALIADYSCSDSGWGVATCQGTVANGAAISTASVGPQTFVVNASDAAGNTASQTVSYAVGYGVCLLYDTSKAKKSGSTYPIQIQLCDANGQNVSSSAVVVHAVSVTMVSTSAPGVLDDAGNSNPDFDFRYDGTIAGYVFNLKTTGFATGTYSLELTAGADPVMHAVPFQIK